MRSNTRSADMRSKDQRQRPETMRTVSVSDFEGLAPHLAAWDDLAWHAPQRIPNLLPAWIDAYLRHRLGPNESWICCFAYLGDRLVGALPLVVTPHPVFGRARPVLYTPYDALTPSGDIVLSADHATLALNALLGEVRRQLPHHLGVDFKAVRQSSALWDALQSGVDGYVLREGFCPKYSSLAVDGDAEAYFAELKKLRSNLRRFRKKLDGRGTVTVELLRGEDATEAFLPEFIALEASGWKGRNGTSIADNPRVVAFYETLVTNFARQGRWEWHTIRVDGRLIAAQMGARCGSGLMLPKYSFDEDFAEFRPGSLLTGEVLRDAFARGEIDEVNPMSDGEAHRTWHMQPEGYLNAHLVRRGPVAAVLQLPRIEAWSFYQNVVRPRIPPGLKAAYQKFRRRGERKPRRAATSRLSTNDAA
ncbi:GNAT family N-acetyltransferase [Microvirga antarctica]|uniref:GNAT family N-acetyltransferase n=1 Tax=Microvirga antarctica TaxID=2819233 RepID=UPI001B30AAC6|nr:GNAT family N-acetyltransferase [Microvirga antarctica]